MSYTLRENEDGTVSVISMQGRELIRGKAPSGKAGISGIIRTFHQKSSVVLRCLRNNTRFFLRATHLESFKAEAVNDGDAIKVSVAWSGGEWSKTYAMADIPPACQLKRLLLHDLLEARGVL